MPDPKRSTARRQPGSAAACSDSMRAAAAGSAAAIATWGDYSVSRCRSHSGAKGPSTSAGAFPMALPLSGEDPKGPQRGSQGVLWDPQDPFAQPGGAKVGNFH